MSNVRQVKQMVEEFKPVFHSFTTGIMIGYNRANEIHTEFHDSIIAVGRSRKKIYFYDPNKYDENIFANCKIKVEVNDKFSFGNTRKNVLNYLPDAFTPMKYRRNRRSQLRRALKFADRLQVKDITMNDLDKLKQIHDEWAEYKHREQNIHPRTYPSYYLATKRCMEASIKLYNKLFFYNGIPVGYVTYDISRDDIAFLVSNIHLYFKQELNLPNQYSDAVILLAYKDLYDLGYTVVNTGGEEYRGLEFFKTKYLGKTIKHTTTSRNALESPKKMTLHDLA